MDILAIERNFCTDLECCNKQLPNLHALFDHLERYHPGGAIDGSRPASPMASDFPESLRFPPVPASEPSSPELTRSLGSTTSDLTPMSTREPIRLPSPAISDSSSASFASTPSFSTASSSISFNSEFETASPCSPTPIDLPSDETRNKIHAPVPVAPSFPQDWPTPPGAVPNWLPVAVWSAYPGQPYGYAYHVVSMAHPHPIQPTPRPAEPLPPTIDQAPSSTLHCPVSSQTVPSTSAALAPVSPCLGSNQLHPPSVNSPPVLTAANLDSQRSASSLGKILSTALVANLRSRFHSRLGTPRGPGSLPAPVGQGEAVSTETADVDADSEDIAEMDVDQAEGEDPNPLEQTLDDMEDARSMDTDEEVNENDVDDDDTSAGTEEPPPAEDSTVIDCPMPTCIKTYLSMAGLRYHLRSGWCLKEDGKKVSRTHQAAARALVEKKGGLKSATSAATARKTRPATRQSSSPSDAATEEDPTDTAKLAFLPLHPPPLSTNPSNRRGSGRMPTRHSSRLAASTPADSAR